MNDEPLPSDFQQDADSQSCKSSSRCGTRRDFLQVLVAAAGVVLIGGCASSPRGKGDAPESAQAPASPQVEKVGGEFKISGQPQLQPGQAFSVMLPDGEPAIIFETNDGKPGALSAKCTHMGCVVNWQPGDKPDLLCPCHGSIFDTNGKVLKGPATRPLARFSLRRDGDTYFLKPA